MDWRYLLTAGGLGVWIGTGTAILIALFLIVKITKIASRLADIRITLFAMAGDKVRKCRDERCGAISLAKATKCHDCGTLFDNGNPA